MPPSQITEVKVVTHSGSFHADDVFGVAVLVLLFEKKFAMQVIERSRDPKVWEQADFVIDVGGLYDPHKNRFDHHQFGGAGERPNGIPYASFGLVWQKYGAEVSGGEDSAALVDKHLVSFIDALDNGVGELKPFAADVYPYSISRAIVSLNPSWREEHPDFDAAFGEAVNFTVPVLRRAIAEAANQIEGEKLAKAAYDEARDKSVIVLNRAYPWEDLYPTLPDVLYVVEPVLETAKEVRWRLKTVRRSPHTFENRKDLPSDWAAKRDRELATITGVPDAVFCHAKLFVAYAKTKDGALALARKALTNNQ